MIDLEEQLRSTFSKLAAATLIPPVVPELNSEVNALTRLLIAEPEAADRAYRCVASFLIRY